VALLTYRLLPSADRTERSCGVVIGTCADASVIVADIVDAPTREASLRRAFRREHRSLICDLVVETPGGLALNAFTMFFKLVLDRIRNAEGVLDSQPILGGKTRYQCSAISIPRQNHTP
jgi:hypothetical protein